MEIELVNILIYLHQCIDNILWLSMAIKTIPEGEILNVLVEEPNNITIYFNFV